jgi:hypothetical protein
MAENKYFAAKDAIDVAGSSLSKANLWFNRLESNGYLEKIRRSWMMYHGAYFKSVGTSHQITFSGEQGELTSLAVNHYHNIAQHMLEMITTNRPAMQAKATNTDYKSLCQTKLANSLLDYYLREKRLEKYLKRAVEYAVVFGSGFIKMEWNSTSGEIYDFNEELNIYEYEGDVQFSNLSPFDVVVDSTKENQDHDWVICRSFKNRYDVAAKYPEYEDRILSLPTKSELETAFFDGMGAYEETDDIPIYEFYHKKSESLPEGRYILFLSEDIVLLDSPLPYRNLPVYRISPSDILGSPYGYTPMFDLMPLQEAINSEYSSILSNHNAFAVQNIWVPDNANISISQLTGSLNIIEGNGQAGPPKALNLTETPKEIYEFLQMLERAQETVSGINSVVRGNPEASLRSGNALALVQSQALQFMSGLQQSYVQLIEDVGSGLLNILRDFASVPRIAMIAGESNRTYMKEFTGDDLSNVNRVIVDVGNPLARSTAGRVQMAEQLLQMGLIRSPEQYLQIINTGKLESMTDETQRELLLIRAENEKLVDGDMDVLTIPTDRHNLHIKEHTNVLADPDLRHDAELVQRVLNHITSHINDLRTVDPDLLSINTEQPLSPPGGSPAGQPGMQAPQGGVSGVQAPPPTGTEGLSLPQPAQAPAPFNTMLPTTPQDLLPQS